MSERGPTPATSGPAGVIGALSSSSSSSSAGTPPAKRSSSWEPDSDSSSEAEPESFSEPFSVAASLSWPVSVEVGEEDRARLRLAVVDVRRDLELVALSAAILAGIGLVCLTLRCLGRLFCLVFVSASLKICLLLLPGAMAGTCIGS